MNKESMEKALECFALISPLLEGGLEAAEKRKRRNEILSKSQISERTLRRYLQAYRQKGLDGLMSKSTSTRDKQSHTGRYPERSHKFETRTARKKRCKDTVDPGGGKTHIPRGCSKSHPYTASCKLRFNLKRIKTKRTKSPQEISKRI